MRDSSKRFEENRNKLYRTVTNMKRDYFRMRPSEKKKKQNNKSTFSLEYITDRQMRKIHENIIRENKFKRIRSIKVLILSIIITGIICYILYSFFFNIYFSKI